MVSHTLRASFYLCVFTLLVGCMGARPYTMLKYDKKTDTFHELKIYADISSVKNAENMWRDRANWIPFILTYYARDDRPDNLSSSRADTAFEFSLRRMGDHRYASVDNDNSDSKDPDKLPELDDIKIQPGKLFLSADKNLCYYHRVGAPGKLIDKIMVECNASACKQLVGSVKAEIDRRKSGGKHLAWGQFQRAFEKHFSGDGEDSPAAGWDNPLTCLDEESLKMLLAAGTAEKPLYSRGGGTITLSLPLSKEDCRGVKAFFDAAKKTFSDPILWMNPLTGPHQDLLRFFAGISPPAVVSMLDATAANGHFNATLTIPAFIDLTPPVIRQSKAIAVRKKDYQEMIDKAKALGADIDEKLTIADVIKEFAAP